MRSHSPTSNMLRWYSTHVELWAYRVGFNMSVLPLWQMWNMSKLESNFKELSLLIYTGTNPSSALHTVVGMRTLSSGFLFYFGVLMLVYVIGFMHQVWFVNNVKVVSCIFISTNSPKKMPQIYCPASIKTHFFAHSDENQFVLPPCVPYKQVLINYQSALWLLILILCLYSRCKSTFF